MTLTQAAFPSRSLLTNAMLVLAGSAFVALAAQIEVPMFPVPMTLQTLAISIIGLTYGSRLAAATLVAYLVEGVMGLPVFAGAGFGLAKLVGPTGGFLLGFVAMAWATGWMVENGYGKGFARLLLAAIIPAFALFVPGVAILKLATGMGWDAAFATGAMPFLAAAVVKAVLAVLAVQGGWKLLGR